MLNIFAARKQQCVRVIVEGIPQWKKTQRY